MPECSGCDATLLGEAACTCLKGSNTCEYAVAVFVEEAAVEACSSATATATTTGVLAALVGMMGIVTFVAAM